jgi:hypothetical protein
MPLNPSEVPERLIEAAKNGNLIPFVGAGLSRLAADIFPNWNELLMQMKDRAVTNRRMRHEEGQEVEQLINRGQVLMAAEALRDSLPKDEYQSILEEKFKPRNVRPTEAHKALFRLHPALILTTNYDNLLEDAYAEEYRRSIMSITWQEAVSIQRYLQGERRNGEQPVIFKIHGTIHSPDSIVLSERDYRQLLYWQPGYRLVMSAIFLTRVILMLGFSFSDPELRLLLEELRESLKHRSYPDYMYLPRETAGSVEARRLREDFGVEVVPYDPTPGHPEVLELINFLIAQKN